MGKRRNIINRFLDFFRGRHSLIFKLHQMEQEMDYMFSQHIIQIEELDQSKIYVIQLKGKNEKEIRFWKGYIDLLCKKLKWTAPKIIVSTEELVEYGDFGKNNIKKEKRKILEKQSQKTSKTH